MKKFLSDNRDLIYGGNPAVYEDALENMKNNRKLLKDRLKDVNKAADEFTKETTTDKARLQGTKETEAPKLKPYTDETKLNESASGYLGHHEKKVTVQEYRQFLNDALEVLDEFDNDAKINFKTNTYRIDVPFIGTYGGYIEINNPIDPDAEDWEGYEENLKSQDVKDRAALAPLIEAANKANKKFSIKRSLKEGFRYTFLVEDTDEFTLEPLDAPIEAPISDEVQAEAPAEELPVEDKIPAMAAIDALKAHLQFTISDEQEVTLATVDENGEQAKISLPPLSDEELTLIKDYFIDEEIIDDTIHLPEDEPTAEEIPANDAITDDTEDLKEEAKDTLEDFYYVFTSGDLKGSPEEVFCKENNIRIEEAPDGKHAYFFGHEKALKKLHDKFFSEYEFKLNKDTFLDEAKEDTQDEEFEEEFKYLEDLRRSGVTNMYGATPYLMAAFEIEKAEARAILNQWMQRYEELNKKYGWQDLDEANLKEVKRDDINPFLDEANTLDSDDIRYLIGQIKTTAGFGDEIDVQYNEDSGFFEASVWHSRKLTSPRAVENLAQKTLKRLQAEEADYTFELIEYNYNQDTEEAYFILAVDAASEKAASDLKEAYADVASATMADGTQVVAAGSSRHTRTYNYEDVTFKFKGAPGAGSYSWQNRPWQRFDFAEALRKAMISAGVAEEFAKECIDKTSNLQQAVEYFAKNYGDNKNNISNDEVLKAGLKEGLPTPTDKEDEQDFIARFMKDKKVIKEFPDQKQRLGVAYSQFKGKKESKTSLKEAAKIISNLSEFKPWAGAVGTWETIIAANKLDALEFMLEDFYPDGITNTALNDLLWFESDWVLDQLSLAETPEAADEDVVEDSKEVDESLKEDKVKDKKLTIEKAKTIAYDKLSHGDYKNLMTMDDDYIIDYVSTELIEDSKEVDEHEIETPWGGKERVERPWDYSHDEEEE